MALASAAGCPQDSSGQAENGMKAMAPVIAVIAAGNMGAAVGRRLADHGASMLTALAGRSAATMTRARAAGMASASDEEIAAADFVLSILPPAEALPLAERLAPVFRNSDSKPVYVDCNAVSPQTAERIAAVIAPTGSAFVDAAIIGGPPQPQGKGPTFYGSGPEAARFAALRDYGLDIRLLDGPLSAASALKMCYGGVTKGVTALGAAMMLAATRGGTADAYFAELQESQPELLAWFKRYVAGMPPKAYRWVAEMDEVASFAGEHAETRQMYEAIARFYEAMGRDVDGEQKDVSALKTFLGKGE
jgi:putative dehydrogenase